MSRTTGGAIAKHTLATVSSTHAYGGIGVCAGVLGSVV